MFSKFDTIVIGAGHAGCEAAMSAAKLGSRVLLITMSLNKIGYLSCNPAMGGIGKGQILREIDALGGNSGIISDLSTIQFRMLNKSKGPAMWSPRAQIDRSKFCLNWKNFIEKNENISLWEDEVTDIIFKNKKFFSVNTKLGITFSAYNCIITSGTFLNGKIFIGKNSFSGGRLGEKSVDSFTNSLNKVGIKSDKLKTGTSVRIDGRTIDFSKMIEQKGDDHLKRFSFDNIKNNNIQKSCFLTYTNQIVHDILKSGIKDSPLYQGMIKGQGPRYCPSIEDKLVKFEDRDKHQIFLEPEGEETYEYYINGFSSSLPLNIQYKALKNIAGLENAHIIRPGYGIEYDYFCPTQLYHSLESKIVENLYFAGQVNGTTGYEEAACQGLIAGINSNRKINGLDPIILKRSEAYIGVLIDDLVTKGTQEPYRMFTSRAEYRILLRQDNADIRLTEKGYKIGLINEQRYVNINDKLNAINSINQYLEKYKIDPNNSIENDLLKFLNVENIDKKVSIKQLIKRPNVFLIDFFKKHKQTKEFIKTLKLGYIEEETIEEVEILIKYEGYINKEKEMVKKIQNLENLSLGTKIDFSKIKGLSHEARQKLSEIKPLNIGQASRISGISPADIAVLLAYLKR